MVAIVAVAALARTLFLEWLPGINGDEAWYGVNVQELLGGGTPFWHTGIGNPLSPLYSGQLLALSTIFEPSATVLRVPEVVLGLLAVALAYPLLRRSLGERPALIATLLLAVSPTAVAYARLGWDPSGTPLVTLLAIGCAMLDRPWLSALACVAAWSVHPTNVFAFPIVAAAWAPHGLDRWRACSDVTRARLKVVAIVACVAMVPVAAWAAFRVAGNPNTSLPSISMVIDRVTSPSLWANRAWGFVNLLSGVSTVLHISGPLPATASLSANVFIAVIALLTCAIGWPVLRAHRYAPWLLVGMLIAFAGFHVVAMDVALTPTAERYGVFMLVPMVLALSLGIDAAWARRPGVAKAATAATTALMVAMTIGGYFVPLYTRGGDAMTTYRTGSVEPKRAALAFIEADSRGAGSVRVVADGWWIYWTLRYLAGANGRIHVDVVPGSNMPGGTHPAGAVPRAVPSPERSYLVSFEGGTLPEDQSGALFTARDRVGRPILNVYAQ